MDAFRIRDELVSDYSRYVRSFIRIRDGRLQARVEETLSGGYLWPEPLIQVNPSFLPAALVDDLVREGVLHRECSRIFEKEKTEGVGGTGKPLRLHRHQEEAVRIGASGASYVLTSGTGSGKSLAYIIPIVDRVLRDGRGQGIRAIVVYPTNALANSQHGELTKFLKHGYADGRGPVTFERYTGQETDSERQRIIANPPDILLTNYVMLELILTRTDERALVQQGQGLRFLVLDELHTYRGRQGADVAMLVRRVREAFSARKLQCVGTSATLAGAGTYRERQVEVATVASVLFGTTVEPVHVIGETLRRACPVADTSDARYTRELAVRIQRGGSAPSSYVELVGDPLSSWIEGVFGVRTDPITGRLERSSPRRLHGSDGAGAELAQLTGLLEEDCASAVAEHLLGSYRCEPDPETGFPAFAFRLHQFISRGDTVYASVEAPSVRFITVQEQQFVPDDRSRVLLPLVFCRECGQDYYCVWRSGTEGSWRFAPRELSDRTHDDGGAPGFLYLSEEAPWPEDLAAQLERIPDDWLEERAGGVRLRRDRRDDAPRPLRLGTSAEENAEGVRVQLLGAPFRFCLRCGVSYGARQTSDFAKLSMLASEGRSSATTILTLAAIRALRREADLPSRARKVLCFSDNRQDTALQAGHFNDFVEVGLLRSALYQATAAAGVGGITHEELTQRVFDALELPLELYAVDPTVRFQALEETRRALREVLGHRLYRDLERGWRITSPNLEECGLLEIRYRSLDDLSAAEDVWEGRHGTLKNATARQRATIAKVLLDFMRRELALKVDYLNPQAQERLRQLSSQRLITPWAIDENERPETAKILFPRSRGADEYRGHVYVSGLGGFGQYLRRPTTLPAHKDRLTAAETEVVIRDLLEALRVAGLVEIVQQPRDAHDVPGYQIPASALTWHAADGTRAFHDPIRVPRIPAEGRRTNEFFVEFYRAVAGEAKGVAAKEHHQMVKPAERIRREEAFRAATLPVLYSTPTMELGVDIAELNVVEMRNVPPTPANYAQRSGRAGRNGQPALVFAYCSTWSSHDQYFFRRPDRMVAGAVIPPRLDLANEDLVRAHVQALWLAESQLSLGRSLRDLLDLGDPELPLLERVRDAVQSESARGRTRPRAQRLLASVGAALRESDWYGERWLDDVLTEMPRAFDVACERWRDLYRSATAQRDLQMDVIRNASRSADDKAKARRLRAEAEAQIDLLVGAEASDQSDFYSYRYFASEGFLPGYNFPRLPISAFIPGRAGARGRDDFLQRPRFIAISEFGPRSTVYYEGSRYQINRVLMPLRREELVTSAAKVCGNCGYLHPVTAGEGPDLCERCERRLDLPLTQLFRLQNVATRRRDRINSDEEERLRLGYEIQTSIRFAEHAGRPSSRMAEVRRDGDALAVMSYGQSATIWRLNLGWARRRNREQHGFVLDIERGYWQRSEAMEEDEDDPMSARTARVIPYVEDRRNCLLFELSDKMDQSTAASLQAALKNAIQVTYELEDAELAAERLPTSGEGRVLLFYEAAEGGAGVLRRLVDDSTALRRVARQALEICHFDPETGEDRRRAPGAREDCEAACYDCLMSYTNQRDHRYLDRQRIGDLLSTLAAAEVQGSPAPASRKEHLVALGRLAGSELEREWLKFLETGDHRLPTTAAELIEQAGTRPDFIYRGVAAVYIDGHPHRYPDRAARDREQSERLADIGYSVIRFADETKWGEIIARYPHVFGIARAAALQD